MYEMNAKTTDATSGAQEDASRGQSFQDGVAFGYKKAKHEAKNIIRSLLSLKGAISSAQDV